MLYCKRVFQQFKVGDKLPSNLNITTTRALVKMGVASTTKPKPKAKPKPKTDD